jgi:hypothetical protein
MLPLASRFLEPKGTMSNGVWLSLQRGRDFQMAALERMVISIASLVSLPSLVNGIKGSVYMNR